MTTETKDHRPSELMHWIVEEAEKRGHRPIDLAKELGVGYVYLTQLIRGVKKSSQMSRKIFENAARYLDIPVAQAYLLGEALLPTDFVHEGKFAADSNNIFKTISTHPDWAGFMPTRQEWAKLSPKMKLALTFAFEQATGIQLTQKPVVPPLAPAAKKTRRTAKSK